MMIANHFLERGFLIDNRIPHPNLPPAGEGADLLSRLGEE